MEEVAIPITFSVIHELNMPQFSHSTVDGHLFLVFDCCRKHCHEPEFRGHTKHKRGKQLKNRCEKSKETLIIATEAENSHSMDKRS